MSATCLKMTGGQREEQVAGELRKLVSDTVVDGVGPIDGAGAVFGPRQLASPVKRRGRGLFLPVCAVGEENPMRVVLS
jgi:hypothetical protein